MASGDSLLILGPLHNEPPAADAATFDTRNSRPCLDFDAATSESCVFTAIMPQHYAGSGVDVIIWWAASTDSTTTHVCTWQGQWEDWSALDLDGDSFAAAQSTGSSPNATLGIPTVTVIGFTNGAQIDNVIAGDPFRLKLTRNVSAGDDMTGDGELYAVELQET